MNKILKYIMLLSMVIIPLQSVSAAGKLSIYHWFEYIPQELLDQFAEEHDVDVTMDTYDSNEAMLASLKAGSLGSYDVAVPGDYMVKIMIGEGLLQKLDKSKFKNFGNVDPNWADVSFDNGRNYSIPYQWGSTSFAVDTAVYKGDINTTDIIFNPPKELAGKINVLDSQAEMVVLASLHLGIPQCTSNKADLQKLNDLMVGAKKHWASFGSDIAKDVLVSGDAAAGVIYNGFSAKARSERKTIKYAYPKQGYILWMDNVVLLKDAPNRDNAVKFMDFLMKPENIAKVTNYAQYASGIKGEEKYLLKELRGQPESNPPADSNGVFIETCDQATQANYDRIWTNLKK